MINEDNIPVGHIYAELMALYAEDAAKTPEPWARWAAQGQTKNFTTAWFRLTGHPTWDPEVKYRRVYDIVTRTISYARPLDSRPKPWQTYYTPDFEEDCGYRSYNWNGTTKDNNLFASELCFATADEAASFTFAMRRRLSGYELERPENWKVEDHKKACV